MFWRNGKKNTYTDKFLNNLLIKTIPSLRNFVGTSGRSLEPKNVGIVLYHDFIPFLKVGGIFYCFCCSFYVLFLLSHNVPVKKNTNKTIRCFF